MVEEHVLVDLKLKVATVTVIGVPEHTPQGATEGELT